MSQYSGDRDTFDTADMAAAVEGITSNGNDDKLASDRRENAERARAHNWAPTVAYDYSVYNANNREVKEILADEPAWLHNAAKYEWCDEYGEVGPNNPALEAQLYHHEFLVRSGEAMEALEYEVEVRGTETVRPVRDFKDAGLHPIMLENVRLCGYKQPTPIQAYTIPAILSGHDVVACAQTGSGKTAAYMIPVLSRLMGKARKLAAKKPHPVGFDPAVNGVRAEPLVLIVCPSRELATQIFDEARRLCYRSMLRPCVVYGGAPIREQQYDLSKGCDVLIATTGRLCDFIDRPHVLSLTRVKYTILDEADEMLHADWESDIQKIMSGGDANEDADHMFLMFSATFPKSARQVARKYMSEEYIVIRVGRAGSTHKNVRQTIVWVDESQKRQALYDLLFSLPPARTLVFVNSKREADMLDDFLYNKDLPSTSIHSDRTQREREDAIRAFRRGTCPILVATGVSGRGLDIKNVMHVINFDLPSAQHGGIEEYVHRIGRTARIGNAGLATSFYNDRNDDIAEDLVKILLETDQQVPDFLESYVPEDRKVTWNDDTDNEEEEAADNNDSGATANGSSFETEGASGWSTEKQVGDDVPAVEEEVQW